MEQLVKNDGDFSLSELGGATLAGALTGGVTAYKPKWLDGATMKTFKHGIYRSGYTKHGETLFRAGDSTALQKGYKYGGYWSRDRPVDEMTVRHDKAIPYHWQGKDGEPKPRNTVDIGLEGRLDAGAAKYSGWVAPQRDAKTGELFEGGGGQVHIPRRYGYPKREEWQIDQE